jgi:hypothetical protein
VTTLANDGVAAATNVGLVDDLSDTVTAVHTLPSGWANTPTDDLSCSGGVCTLTITDGDGGKATIRVRARIN